MRISMKTGIIRPDTKVPGQEETRRKLIYYNMDRSEQLAYDEHLNAAMIQNDVLSTAQRKANILPAKVMKENSTSDSHYPLFLNVVFIYIE